MFEATSFHHQVEVREGEMLKSVAEVALNSLSRYYFGQQVIERYAFGRAGRIENKALQTVVADLDFESPVMVGAGWDKKGRNVHGLYLLGFSGVEVGTVPLFGQPGNNKPRLWTLDSRHSVGRNRLGFNSDGSEAVDNTLTMFSPFPCPVGINVGRNKLTPDEWSPRAHAEVVKRLHKHASYFVFNPSSPNTVGLRDLQHGENLRAHMKAMNMAMAEAGGLKPLFIKISPDITHSQLFDIAEVVIEEGGSGLIIFNTTTSSSIKAKYGLPTHAEGGISGNDWEYRSMCLSATAQLYEEYGDRLEIIGVGGISEAEHAIQRLQAGASIVQVVTGIREHKGKTAFRINAGILDWLHRYNYPNVKNIIGAATRRGAKYPMTS